MFDLDLMRRLSSAASPSEAEIEQCRQHRDGFDEAIGNLEAAGQPDLAVPPLSDAEAAKLISVEARDVVIGFEVGSRRIYDAKFRRPDWPKGASGITIGIGYDLGYASAAEINRHWGDLLSPDELHRLIRVSGTKGASAGQVLSDVKNIDIPWDTAFTVFERATMPKFAGLALRAFPHAADLEGHCFGALFSLVFNRGASMQGDTRQEMRNIRDLCIAQRYEPVPKEFRDMGRHWRGKGLAGLVKRRDAEAILFERGLEQRRLAVPAAGLSKLESVIDARTLDGDGALADEEERAVLEGTHDYEAVKWPARDDEAPDYRHIADRGMTGKTFELDHRGLELLIGANNFEPLREHGRIIFALRGAELVTSLGSPAVVPRQVDRDVLILRDCRPDHKNLRCVIGVYDLATGRLSGFASSTVPNRGAVAGYHANRQAGNMMPTGRYRFEVNWHLASKADRKIPGCLVENGRQKCVLRSINNLSYDIEDVWENDRLHGDNLHPAKSAQSAAFSSLGCLVVSGNYVCDGSDRAKGTHTGEWAEFRKALGLTKPGTGDHGRVYDVVLLTGLEAAIAGELVKSGNDSNATIIQGKLGRLRFGSSGERVKRLQRGLGLRETGNLTHDVLKAWISRQHRDNANRAQAVYGPADDALLGFDVFAPLPSATAANTAQFESVGTADAPPAAADPAQLYYEIGLQAEAARRNASAGGVSLESIDDGSLESINLEFGFNALKAAGANLVKTLERQLQQYICSDQLGNALSREDIRGKIDEAGKKGTEAVKRQLARLLTGAAVGIPVSSGLAEKIVDAVLGGLLQNVSAAAADRIDISAQWICQRWGEHLGATGAGAAPQDGGASAADAEQPPTVVAEIISRIEAAAAAMPPDSAVVRQLVRDLNAQSAAGAVISDTDMRRLLKTLADTPFLDQIAGASGGDPYVLMRDVQAALKKTPPDKGAARRILSDLHTLLADARQPLQVKEVQGLLKVLRGARMHDELSWISDRFASRDHNMLGVVATSYAQGLIDSGRLVAAVEFLRTALELYDMPPGVAEDATGILGRAHKQIYVNHISTPSDAIHLRDSIGKQLTNAIECYGRCYDPARPAHNYYHGINYVALLKRAERDGLSVEAKGNADQLASNMIEALEPKAVPQTKDSWLLASVGEAHLALGRMDKAAEYFALYTRHQDTDAFALNGTIRQLEEVWQLKAGTGGAAAILTNMKAALARMETGFVSLSGAERHAIASAGAGAVEFQNFFESATPGGKYINFAVLKRIVECGASVAAIQVRQGQSGRTIGTGFLVRGSDFHPGHSSDKSYVLTNAHVVWDTKDGPPAGSAIQPHLARIVFETDLIEGRNEAYGCSVVWQSPPSKYDAALLELDRRVLNRVPLEVAPPSFSLVVASDTTKGSKLAVLGHPRGGNLSVGVLGNLDEMHGTLIDHGPNADTADPVFLHYVTPTEPGNSGSPVFDAETWRVVGLHHAGFPDGGRPRLRGMPGTNLANEGIWIESIRLKARQELGGRSEAGLSMRKAWWR